MCIDEATKWCTLQFAREEALQYRSLQCVWPLPPYMSIYEQLPLMVQKGVWVFACMGMCGLGQEQGQGAHSKTLRPWT